MVNLPDGQIIIIGGHEEGLDKSRTLFYDPITSIFTEGPQFPEDLDAQNFSRPLDFPKCTFFYRGPFKYYVSMFLAFLGPPTAPST